MRILPRSPGSLDPFKVSAMLESPISGHHHRWTACFASFVPLSWQALQPGAAPTGSAASRFQSIPLHTVTSGPALLSPSVGSSICDPRRIPRLQLLPREGVGGRVAHPFGSHFPHGDESPFTVGSSAPHTGLFLSGFQRSGAHTPLASAHPPDHRSSLSGVAIPVEAIAQLPSEAAVPRSLFRAAALWARTTFGRTPSAGLLCPFTPGSNLQ